MRHIISAEIEAAPFFSILSDGSQARKSGSEKELVLARVIKNGEVVHFVVALENVDDLGDATGANVKQAIDNAFKKKLGKNNCFY